MSIKKFMGYVLTHQDRINILHHQLQSSTETIQDPQTSVVKPKITYKSDAAEYRNY